MSILISALVIWVVCAHLLVASIMLLHIVRGRLHKIAPISTFIPGMIAVSGVTHLYLLLLPQNLVLAVVLFVLAIAVTPAAAALYSLRARLIMFGCLGFDCGLQTRLEIRRSQGIRNE